MYIKNNLLEPGVSSWNMTQSIESRTWTTTVAFLTPCHFGYSEYGSEFTVHARKEIDNIGLASKKMKAILNSH